MQDITRHRKYLEDLHRALSGQGGRGKKGAPLFVHHLGRVRDILAAATDAQDYFVCVNSLRVLVLGLGLGLDQARVVQGKANGKPQGKDPPAAAHTVLRPLLMCINTFGASSEDVACLGLQCLQDLVLRPAPRPLEPALLNLLHTFVTHLQACYGASSVDVARALFSVWGQACVHVATNTAAWTFPGPSVVEAALGAVRAALLCATAETAAPDTAARCALPPLHCLRVIVNGSSALYVHLQQAMVLARDAAVAMAACPEVVCAAVHVATDVARRHAACCWPMVHVLCGVGEHACSRACKHACKHLGRALSELLLAGLTAAGSPGSSPWRAWAQLAAQYVLSLKRKLRSAEVRLLHAVAQFPACNSAQVLGRAVCAALLEALRRPRKAMLDLHMTVAWLKNPSTPSGHDDDDMASTEVAADGSDVGF